jgi:hypothetical protein
MRPGFESPWGRHFIRNRYGNLRGTRRVILQCEMSGIGRANKAAARIAAEREKSHSNVNGTRFSSTDQLLVRTADKDSAFSVPQNPLCRHQVSVRPCRRLLSCYTPRSSSPSPVVSRRVLHPHRLSRHTRADDASIVGARVDLSGHQASISRAIPRATWARSQRLERVPLTLSECRPRTARRAQGANR